MSKEKKHNLKETSDRTKFRYGAESGISYRKLKLTVISMFRNLTEKVDKMKGQMVM